MLFGLLLPAGTTAVAVGAEAAAPSAVVTTVHADRTGKGHGGGNGGSSSHHHNSSSSHKTNNKGQKNKPGGKGSGSKPGGSSAKQSSGDSGAKPNSAWDQALDTLGKDAKDKSDPMQHKNDKNTTDSDQNNNGGSKDKKQADFLTILNSKGDDGGSYMNIWGFLGQANTLFGMVLIPHHFQHLMMV